MIDWFAQDFFWYALTGSLITALFAGALGCFVVWQGMSYFGAALAHSALLGVALGFLFGVNIKLAVVITAMSMGLVLTFMRSYSNLREQLQNDVILGFLAHIAMALGIVALVAIDDVRIDLFSYLFGDVLTISVNDIWFLLLSAIVASVILVFIWRPLLMIIVDEELAKIEGVNVAAIRLVFILLLAWMVAIAMQVVGVLLVASFLIIPAATARRLVSTPIHMLVIACLLACVAVTLGIAVSFQWDIPAGPMMVIMMALLFVTVWLVPQK